MIATKVVTITVPRTSLEKALEERKDPNRGPGNYCVISPLGRIACEGREIILPAAQQLIMWAMSDLNESHFAGILFAQQGRDTIGEMETPNQDVADVLAIPNPQTAYPSLTPIEKVEDERLDIDLTTHLMMGSWAYNMDTLVARADERGFKCTGWGNPGVDAFLDIINGGPEGHFERERRVGHSTDLSGN